MPIILQRPDPLLDALTGYVNAQQNSRFQHDQRKREEKERDRQRNLQLGLAAAAAVGGIIAAPALGLAGTAATAGFAPGAVGVGVVPAITGTAATSGLLGAGGTLSGLGAAYAGLQGASLGANLASGISSGNLAQPLSQAAGVVGGLVQQQQDRAVYGYNPSAQEKSAFAQAAVKAGTNIGALRQQAMQQGITLPQALAQAQQQAQQREISIAGDTAFAETSARLNATEQAAMMTRNYEYVPDDVAISALQEEKRGVITSMRQPPGGGEAQLNSEEGAVLLGDIDQRMQLALQGTLRRRTAPEFALPNGATMTINQPTDVNGRMIVAEQEANGSVNWKQLGDAPPMWKSMPPGPERDASREAWARDELFTIDGKLFRETADGLAPLSKEAEGDKYVELLLRTQAAMARANPLGTVPPMEEVVKQIEAAFRIAPILKAKTAGQATEPPATAPIDDGEAELQRISAKMLAGEPLTPEEEAIVYQVANQAEGQ